MTEPGTTPSAQDRRRSRDETVAAPLRAVAEAVQDAIVSVDEAGRITKWLAGAETLFGWTRQEAVGRPLTMIMPPELRSRHLEAFARAVGGHSSGLIGGGPVELEALRKEGTTFPVELTLSVGELDDAPFFVGVIRDISARRIGQAELVVAQERFRSAFEHAATGMTMTTPDGHYIAANAAFCRLVSRGRDELLGTAFSDITHPSDQETDLHLVARLAAGESDHERLEKRYLRADGTVIWVEGNVSLVRDAEGGPLHYLTQVIDVTERRRAAQDLARSNAELTQLASVAAHDLNEPLRIVEGFLRLLEGRAGEALDEQGRRFVAEAITGAQRMRELIDALLRYARAGGGEIRRDPVDLAAVAAEVEAALATAIQGRGATVEIGPLPTVAGDAALLRQVLQNLLANALRHARPDDPRVRVSARATDDAWELSVADNGPGIPDGLHDTAFDLFARGPEGGTGLGLAICRRAVERHGGTIWIADAHEGGADLRFTLPRAD